MNKLPRGNWASVHLLYQGQVAAFGWTEAMDILQAKVLGYRLQHLPHGQRELAYLAVGTYVALGGEIEAPQRKQ